MFFKKLLFKQILIYKGVTNYTATSIISGLLKFLIVYFSANQMNPSNFAFIGLHGMLIYGFTPLLNFGSQQLVSINIVNLEYVGYKAFLNIYISLTISITLFLGVILWSFSSFISQEQFILILLSLVHSLLINIFSVHQIELIQNKNSKEYLKITILNTLSSLIFVLIIFKLKGTLTWTDIILSYIIGNVLSLMISTFRENKLLRNLKVQMNFVEYKNLIVYGWPLLVSVIGTWILTQSDKLFVEKYFDFNTLGVYSFALQISAMHQIVNRALVNTYSPLIFHRLKNNIYEYKDVYNSFLRTNIYLIIVNAIFIILLYKFFINTEYANGIFVALLSLLVYFFDGLYKVPGLVIDYTKKNVIKLLGIFYSAGIFIFSLLILIRFTFLESLSPLIAMLVSYIFLSQYFFQNAKKIQKHNN